jgi:ankyrin repeat protein
VAADDPALLRLIRAIAEGDVARASGLIIAEPALARACLERGASRQEAKDFFLESITHYVYAGDSALHVAAAGYRPELARTLVSAGADVSARNRRGAQPLHYASDGAPGSPHWNPSAQAETITLLTELGADPNTPDASGVAPLHRAVRTCCSAAVSALIAAGADPHRPNRSGSTPMQLATRNTGRGGTGSEEAIAERTEIVRLLARHGATPG